MALRAVTLDAGGTLIEVAEPVATTYVRVAAAHGIGLDPEAVARQFRDAFRAAPPLAFPGVQPDRIGERERAWWRAVVRPSFGAGARQRGFGPCFDELYAWYARPDAWRVLPGAQDALAALQGLGLRLAVVSNFDRRLETLLADLGLTPWLDTIVCSARTGHAKPDPRIFHAALARLGVSGADTLHVGDDPDLDLAGAQAAGLDAVLVQRTGSAPPPRVRTIASIGELPALVTLF